MRVRVNVDVFRRACVRVRVRVHDHACVPLSAHMGDAGTCVMCHMRVCVCDRATSDAYLKAANELKLATGPRKAARDAGYVAATATYTRSLYE